MGRTRDFRPRPWPAVLIPLIQLVHFRWRGRAGILFADPKEAMNIRYLIARSEDYIELVLSCRGTRATPFTCCRKLDHRHGPSLRYVTWSNRTRSMEHPRVSFDVQAWTSQARRKHRIQKCWQPDRRARRGPISFELFCEIAPGSIDSDETVRVAKSNSTI